jgi:DNA polymerase III subunit delta
MMAKKAEPSLDDLIAEATKDGPRPVYLFSGDEFLMSQAVEKLVDALVPAGSRDFNLALLDGAATDAPAIARDLAQAPMFRGVKLVVVKETTLLTGKADLGDEARRARQLFDDGRPKDAARRMLAAVGKAKWSIGDLTDAPASRFEKDLGLSADDLGREFLTAIRDLAEKEGLAIPEGDTATLERALEGGAPPDNALVLTCAKPDRRLALTKLIEKLGVHLSCKAEQRGRSIDDLDIGAVKEAVLKRYGKRIEPAAEKALKRAIGDELRLLAGELEKLCLFVGEDAKVITAADVEAVGVRQIREEAFWELGGAVSGRDLPAALWYLHDAFDHGKHPVPVLGGIASALRKTLQVRAVAEKHGIRRGGRDLPARVVSEVAELRGGRKPHPYALRMEYERSLAWPGQADLSAALAACRAADRALKTSRGDPRLVVERLVMGLCPRR